MNIKEKFLELTTHTYPHSHESELFHMLPDCLEFDEFGNLFYQIGETSTMFTCHLDTATSAYVPVIHVIEDDMIKTDGKSILGADDKAGCVIMLHMIEEKVPGLYYFFLGEEVGCIGSRKLSDKFKTDKLLHIQKVISFDRRGTTNIITHQSGSRCCSDTFGKALAEAINIAGKEIYDNDTILVYEIDPTGIYTDSAQFVTIYPECTNISVGYYSEHNYTERQNIKHLDKLAKACCLVDWETLPIERDHTVVEHRSFSSYGYGYGRYSEYNWEDEEEYYVGQYSTRTIVSKNEDKFFLDYKYGSFASKIVIEKSTKNVKDIELSPDRIKEEVDLILELFDCLEVVYKSVSWTGMKLMVFYEVGSNFVVIDRNELAITLPELNFWQFEVERQEADDIFVDPSWIF